MDLQSVLDKIEYIGQKRDMKPSDIQAIKAAISHLNEKNSKKEAEYVKIMDLVGSVYRIPSDLVQEFNELDEKLFEATNEAILSQSENILKYSDLLNEWCEKFEKYRIEG